MGPINNFLLTTLLICSFILTESLFIPPIYSDYTNLMAKISSVIITVLATIFIKRNIKWYNFYVLVGIGFMLYITLITLYKYNFFLHYPNVIRRLLLPMTSLGVFVTLLRIGKLNFARLINFILVGFFVTLFVYGNFNHFKFNSEERPVTASVAYLILLASLYKFNLYFDTKKNKDLWASIILFIIVFALFHRTVWIATVFSFAVNIFILRIKLKIDTSVLSRLLLIVFIVGAFFLALILYIFPQVRQSIELSLQDVANYKEQGTGSWRYEQGIFYWNRIIERPILGWDFDAYELGEVMENETFNDKGTYIHSGYIDILYYFGVVGLFYHYGILLLIIWKYKNLTDYTPQQLTLLCFVLSGFVYSVSYQLPYFFWLICGISMYYLYVPKLNNLNRYIHNNNI